MKKYEVIIGIDPDVHRSGVAVKSAKKLSLLALSFFEVFELLQHNKDKSVLVRIEAGWLNAKSNFHGWRGQSKATGERIAKNVGANAEVGKKLIEMCKFLGIDCEPVKPQGKIKAELFEKMTGEKVKNQDIVDAAMLVIGYNAAVTNGTASKIASNPKNV